MKQLLLSTIIFACCTALCAADECDRPWPVEVPDGKTASKEEILAAQRGVKAYMADVDIYLLCLEEEGAAVKVDPDDTAAVEDALQQQAIRDRRHNAMVDEMELLAERFNQAVRDFKAR